MKTETYTHADGRTCARVVGTDEWEHEDGRCNRGHPPVNLMPRTSIW